MFRNILDQIAEVWRGMNVPQRTAVVTVTLAVVATLVVVGTLATKPEYRLLYGNLEESEAATVMARLQEWEVPYELRAGGRAIWVGADVAEMRLRLTEAGVRPTSDVGYAELFDKAGNSFGKTEFEMNMNWTRAQQGEVAKILKRLPFVQSADVMIARPQPTLFVEERKAVTASVVIVPRMSRLTEEQVLSIADYVAGAVPGLDSDNVTIMDSRGRTLNGPDRNGTRFGAGNQLSLQHELEETLAERALSQLYAMVGPGKASVRVSASLDFQQLKETIEDYDEDSPVVREERVETSETAGGDVGGAAGIDGRISGGAGGSGSSTSSETIDNKYEIDKTVRTIVRDGATVQRLTVSVVADESFREQATEIEGIVASAVGLQKDRGDEVSLAFTSVFSAEEEAPVASPGPLGMTPDQIVGLLETGGAIVALLVLFLLVRPILSRSLARVTPPEPAAAIAAVGPDGQLPGGAEGIPQLTASGQPVSPAAQLTQLIDSDPEKVAKIMKTWVSKEEV